MEPERAASPKPPTRLQHHAPDEHHGRRATDCGDETRRNALSDDNHRALTLLASSPRGMSEGILSAHGISIDDMVELVRAGHVTARGERIRVGDRVIEVAIVTITAPGVRQSVRRTFVVSRDAKAPEPRCSECEAV